ncbi:MAG: Uncharacterized protein XD58_0063 [Thermotoga sp. 50_1627]|uniref:hypothetical protein n=1 Tax=Pseudothermotoga sp. TaxID=2033661 RepID=UPI00076DBDD0|nr:MAG: Uncharacterized protein XD45_0052 [Thermotoga sp. 50_64]KUK25902.1 MAG: Uncharacterized protein XD58_0063 [Thermotoga sp. 50_1627]MBC7116115.1 hypothetical protein [Pseudothermotoga sp.]MDK2922804.1 hypothetical protein [Pseudothermotoga sp.]HBT38563.1 hypothetical protein [Pseudothermotoga sp.]
MEDVLLQIANACAQDASLLEIVRHVASMSDEEKALFKTKVKVYFLNRTGEIDLQAYEFFRLILEDKNAERVLQMLEEGSNQI